MGEISSSPVNQAEYKSLDYSRLSVYLFWGFFVWVSFLCFAFVVVLGFFVLF